MWEDTPPPRHRQAHCSRSLTSLFISSEICGQQHQGENPPFSPQEGLPSHAEASGLGLFPQRRREFHTRSHIPWPLHS